MEFLIRAALIVDSNSPHHLTQKDILISQGSISKIEDQVDFEGEIINIPGLRVSPGWFDMRAHYNDPGLEYKEDLESGTNAAAAGGFTDVLLLPNTSPRIDGKNAVSYYGKWNRGSAVKLHASAAVSLKCEGKELTEMIDLHHAGAKAFTDGTSPVWHTDIMLKSLQYLQKFDGLLINRPEDHMLTAFGTMHEGVVSTRMGMKGIPSLSEEVMVKRDLQLLEYTGGKLHFSLLSTAGSVAMVKEAKAKGLNVTADVGVHHLIFEDESLIGYDTHLKVKPPFRLKSDREALIEGVKDGTIDVIVTDHQPHDLESKKLEFDLADFGIIGQQSFYSALLSVFGNDTDKMIDKVCQAPRVLLNIDSPVVTVGNKACLTLFTPEQSWEYTATVNQSKSLASPFLGQNLQGKVVGIVNDGQKLLNGY